MGKDLKAVAPFLITSSALLLALAPGLPYVYYQLLRFVVCGAAIFAILEYFERRPSWGWGCIAVAVVFNPLYPVHFNREIWQIIDVIVAVFFTFAAFIFHRSNVERKQQRLESNAKWQSDMRAAERAKWQ